MTRLFRKVKQSIGRQFNRAAYKATENLNSEVEELISKTLANEEIEEIVVRAVERVIFSLLRRYWLVLFISLLVLLGAQTYFLSITIAALLRK